MWSIYPVKVDMCKICQTNAEFMASPLTPNQSSQCQFFPFVWYSNPSLNCSWNWRNFWFLDFLFWLLSCLQLEMSQHRKNAIFTVWYISWRSQLSMALAISHYIQLSWSRSITDYISHWSVLDCPGWGPWWSAAQKIQQPRVAHVDDAPGHEGAGVVDVHPSEHSPGASLL